MQPTPSSGPTLGLEEELHVVDAGTGRLTSRGPELLDGLGADPARAASFAEHGSVVAELTLSQVETVTSVATSVETVLDKALALRSVVAREAEHQGVALVATGTPVLGDAGEQQVAPDERYRALRDRGAGLVEQQLIAGMHLHVGVGAPGPVADADDDARVAVADALRLWLPPLLAMTANSPYWLGHDTGFASYRQVHWQRWPVAGPPPFGRDAAGYAAAVGALVDAGVVDDASYAYWDLRLATRYPTVEVRVADVVPTVDDAAVFVALVRGLVARALADHEAGRHAPDVPLHALRAATWRAARYGLSDRLVDPTSGTLAPAHEVLRTMAEHARPGLEACGDLDRARDGLGRVLREGNGADRQRRAFERGGWSAVLDVVVDAADADRAVGTHGDGNGWVRCAAGHRHWGRHGAAGLVVVRPGPRGPQVLVQLRAAWTHQGGTWGVPGGARDSHESVSQAARREAVEEAGVEPAQLVDVAEVVDDHGGWSYTYVVATAPADARAFVANRESDRVDWVELDDVPDRPLHPALAESWPRLRELVDDLGARV
ncbi:hypothetical protein GCM10027446_26710 [Angustibacter peucedani]